MTHTCLLTLLAMVATAGAAHAQQTQRWSESQAGPVYTERWSESQGGSTATQRWSESQNGPSTTQRWSESLGGSGQGQRWSESLGNSVPAHRRPRPQNASSPQRSSAAPAPGTNVLGGSARPMAGGGTNADRVEVRSGCHVQFSSRSGPKVPIRWFGITQDVTIVGRRANGELCALFEDGSSEWIASNQVMTAAEKQAHDQHMQALGAGLQRQQALTGSSPHQMMDKLRETSNALNRETQELYRQTEKHYEDRRRYGR